MDAYDRMIESLADSPRSVTYAWDYPSREDCGPLFAKCSFDRSDVHHRACGCLTQIRYSDTNIVVGRDGPREDLTYQIASDERLPTDIWDFHRDFTAADRQTRVAMLQPFAEWQRRLDKELGREPLEV